MLKECGADHRAPPGVSSSQFLSANFDFSMTPSWRGKLELSRGNFTKSPPLPVLPLRGLLMVQCRCISGHFVCSVLNIRDLRKHEVGHNILNL